MAALYADLACKPLRVYYQQVRDRQLGTKLSEEKKKIMMKKLLTLNFIDRDRSFRLG
jgi:hypothetical protein